MGRATAAPRVEPECRLVRFRTDGDVDLAGVLFEPERRSSRVVVFLHGMGGSFESRRTNLLAAQFTAAGMAYFAFNNRGSYLMRRAGSGLAGTAFERIRDCVDDIGAAVREMRRRGYRDVTLIGHSTGANKIAVYDHYKPRNPVKRYVFLGAGDDTGLAYDHLGARRFRPALEKARQRIRDGRGGELVPEGLVPMPPLSWLSFYDIANPDGEYNVFPFLELLRGVRLSRKRRFRYLRAIRKPSLALWGAEDEYCFGDVSGCVAVTAEALGPKPNFELAILAGADHGFSGKEEVLAKLLIDWME